MRSRSPRTRNAACADRLTDWLFNSLSRWLTLLEMLDPRKVADVPLWQRSGLRAT